MGFRDSKSDFEASNPNFNGLSADDRPDSISSDYLISFSPGPIAISDITEGLLYRPWRLRYENGNYYISDFNTESVLFSDSAVPTSISLAFDQSGFPLVAAEIEGDVWLYWFDPVIPGFTFDNLGEGRTPRLILDQPNNIPNSDVQLFYINGTDLCNRIQNERFEDENVIRDNVDENCFIESAYISAHRLHVIWSVRDEITKRYSLKSVTSLLFPINIDTEAVEARSEVLSVVSVIVIIPESFAETEAFFATNEVLAIECFEPIIEDAFEDEAFFAQNEVMYIESVVPLRPEDLEDEAFFASNEVLSVTSVVVIITAAFEKEAFYATNEILSVSSIVP